jgi:di- and tripeptidase
VIRSCLDVGDIFSVLFTPESQLLFFGCQNTSIQWCDFKDYSREDQQINSETTQKTQFFQLFHDFLGIDASSNCFEESGVVQHGIKPSNIYSNAHDGYVYCMTCAVNIPNVNEEVLITGKLARIHSSC